MEKVVKIELLEYFSEFVTSHKKDFIEKILAERTNYITVVLEDIFQPQNASAVIRTCDCFGIQKIHVVEERNSFNENRDVTLGSAQWVDVIHYKQQNIVSCVEQLKDEGYTIVATTPGDGGIEINDLKTENKLALMFGTEINGLSKKATSMADVFVNIPMVGFIDSLNLSVCAAIFLYTLTNKLRDGKIDYHLTDNEKLDLRLKWMKSIVKNGDVMEKEFFSRRDNGK